MFWCDQEYDERTQVTYNEQFEAHKHKLSISSDS
jgi:hypothetical protein